MFGESDIRREDLAADEPMTAQDGVEQSGHEAMADDAAGAVPTPPVTGDEAVDEAMMRLAESQSGSFAERIDAGEHAHRSLQSRLGGLGGA
ncbi:hypothetical protein GCM10009721_36880 [Terrabacter tumescens]|uniref:Uncharacterized protein n=1 Tax=Terrabacter tumescens TaxID=60443 RepID=A0ABQ2IE82_9MICO|nr:hypothetical protein [Terrabacter tumescens]GGN05952.1 hypothetical protein GCM10009721_36880 [Terrabacter tumescens]